MEPPSPGLGTIKGFIAFHPRLPDAAFLSRVVGLFIMTGIPEELMFHGLILNLPQKVTKSTVAALILLSVIFGERSSISPIPFSRP